MHMKQTKNLIIGIVICVIVFAIIIGGYMIIKVPKTTSQTIDCTDLKQNFDNYAAIMYSPMIWENPESLCHEFDYLKSTPKWAVGELIAIRGHRLTFEGILEDATIPMELTDAEVAQYKIGKNYKIDMNNICRWWSMMVDNRAYDIRDPSPISYTFVKPEEINCKVDYGEGCSIDSDCILPPEPYGEPYGLSSYGPYDAKCIDSHCKIVDDLLEDCKIDMDCNCSSYNPPNLPKEYVACSCINKSCHVIVEE